jgi:hypothetical protein
MGNDRARGLYLDLMKRCLTNTIYRDPDMFPGRAPTYDPARRAEARDWPSQAHTMIGPARLDNLQQCIEDVIARRVPGDLIETGVWRGGACIFMRAVLAAWEEPERRVWVADSFRGLPEPDLTRYPLDRGAEILSTYAELAVSADQVRANFASYGLLDERVMFLEGWFSESLPRAPVERLAVLRLDGDMYESTMEALVHLYPKLAPGGWCIVDDYNDIPQCGLAVNEYRKQHGITDPIQKIDWAAVFWRKSG